MIRTWFKKSGGESKMNADQEKAASSLDIDAILSVNKAELY